MSGKQLKYVRTTQGFLVFPPLAAMHKQVAAATGWPVLSAGFVDWDADGRPLCMGESDSLGIKSREDDTAALRAEWGMHAPAAPAALTPVVPDEPVVCPKCGGGGYGYIDVFEGALCHFDARCPDCNPAPVTLTPAMRADAAAIGACCDPMSLEPSEPA